MAFPFRLLGTVSLGAVLAVSASAQGFTLTPITGQRYACTAGQVVTSAGTFPCQNVDLMSFLPLASLGGTTNSGTGTVASLATTWGWADPATGREYAIVGRSDGTAFVDVTDPLNPVYLGLLPRPATQTNTPANAVSVSLWKELKVLNNHVFVVSEATGHGMQTFDLARLRGVTTPQTFTETGRYTGFGRAHNVLVSEASNTAIGTGMSADGTTRQAGCGQGLEFVDVSNPASPVFAGCYNGPVVNGSRGYTHDAQCVAYHGPDTRYTGREICLMADEKVIHIVDVTQKSSVQLLGSITYPNVSYAHQGWLSEDQRYFFFDDETDETNGFTGGRTKTLIFDVQSLTTPVLAGSFTGRTGAIDHNQYVRGSRLFQANYTAGLAILDVSNPTALAEVGYFDTYPANDNARYDGIWNVYPYFPSGNVVVGGMDEGLFVLRPTGLAVATASAEVPARVALRLAGPNPSDGVTEVQMTTERPAQARVAVFDALGREVLVVHNGTLSAGIHRLPVLGQDLASGTYVVRAHLDGHPAGDISLVVVR